MLRFMMLVMGLFLLWVVYEGIRTTGIDWDTVFIIFIGVCGIGALLTALYADVDR